MKKHISLIIIIACIVIIIGQIAAILYLKENYVVKSQSIDASDSVIISEICVSNYNIIQNEMGETSGYIELYNNTLRNIDLSSYYLTNDDVSYNLPNIILPPREYVLVWASSFIPVESEDGSVTTASEIFCGFEISSGNKIVLSKGEDVVQEVEIPDLSENETYSLIEETWQIANPSPLKKSDISYSLENIPDAPSFSNEGGFYDSSVSIKLTASENCTIYYTTDCSEPNSESTLYSNSINIGDINSNTEVSAFVIRAVAVDEEGRTSKISTSTYFIGDFDSQYTDANILSIVADPNDLYGQNGILSEEYISNSISESAMGEKLSSVEMYDAKGNAIITDNCGLSVFTSLDTTEAATLSLSARKVFSGSNVFSSSFFDGQKSNKVTLYPTKQDSDLNAVLSECNVEPKNSKEVICFINGRYYSTATLSQEYDYEYFESNYEIKDDDLVLIDGSGVEIGSSSDYQQYVEMIEFVSKHDMSDKDNYQSFEEVADAESFINYMAINLYLGNKNIGMYENVKLFRTKSRSDDNYHSTKWHWLLCYDTESILSKNPFYEGYISDSNAFEKLVDSISSIEKHTLFTKLLKNEEFKSKFIGRFFELYNTVFNPEYLDVYLNKYNLDENGYLSTFFSDRSEYSISQVMNSLNITDGLCYIEINCPSDKAIISIGDFELTEVDATWFGYYPTGCPVEINLTVNDAYKFTGWEGDIETRYPTLIIAVEANTSLTATFKEK